MVKMLLALLSSFAIIGALSGSADDILPKRFSFDRYKGMVNHSPFAIATAVALPEATPDFAKDLYIANAARSPEGDMVTLVSSSDHNFKKYLTTREPVDGYGITQIEWSEDVGKTKVTISKDGKFATLTFNQALLARQGASGARPSAPLGRQAAPLMPPSIPDQTSRALSHEVIQQDPEEAPAPSPNLALITAPGLAAIAVPNLDGGTGIDRPGPRLQQQQPKQNDDALSDSERKEMEEASRK